MHDIMMNCLYLLVTILSVLGVTAAVLILVGVVKGITDLIDNHRRHDEK